MKTILLIFILAIACSASFFTKKSAEPSSIMWSQDSKCLCDDDYMALLKARKEWAASVRHTDSLEQIKDSLSQIIFKKIGW